MVVATTQFSGVFRPNTNFRASRHGSSLTAGFTYTGNPSGNQSSNARTVYTDGVYVKPTDRQFFNFQSTLHGLPMVGTLTRFPQPISVVDISKLSSLADDDVVKCTIGGSLEWGPHNKTDDVSAERGPPWSALDGSTCEDFSDRVSYMYRYPYQHEYRTVSGGVNGPLRSSLYVYLKVGSTNNRFIDNNVYPETSNMSRTFENTLEFDYSDLKGKSIMVGLGLVYTKTNDVFIDDFDISDIFFSGELLYKARYLNRPEVEIRNILLNSLINSSCIYGVRTSVNVTFSTAEEETVVESKVQSAILSKILTSTTTSDENISDISLDISAMRQASKVLNELSLEQLDDLVAILAESGKQTLSLSSLVSLIGDIDTLTNTQISKLSTIFTAISDQAADVSSQVVETRKVSASLSAQQSDVSKLPSIDSKLSDLDSSLQAIDRATASLGADIARLSAITSDVDVNLRRLEGDTSVDALVDDSGVNKSLRDRLDKD